MSRMLLLILLSSIFSSGCTASQLNAFAVGMSLASLGADIHYKEKALQVASQPKTVYVHHINDTPTQPPASNQMAAAGTVTPQVEEAMTKAAISESSTPPVASNPGTGAGSDKLTALDVELGQIAKMREDGKISEKEAASLRKKALARY